MLNLLDEIQFVQDTGKYPEWIAKFTDHDQLKITGLISEELQALRQRTSFDRLNELDHVLYYYSDSRHAFKKTAIGLHEKVGYSRYALEEGHYDPDLMASRMVSGIAEYDSTVVVPIIQQIQNELLSDFPRNNILFLGRDFTSIYTYASGNLDRTDNLFLSNISRKIRDAVSPVRPEGAVPGMGERTPGKYDELRLMLAQIGLTKERLLDQGLVICDSSRMGKVPAVIFKAIAFGMTPAEAHAFLTNAHVRYIYSLCNKGMTISEKAMDMAMGDQLPRCQVEAVTKSIEMISEFKIEFPSQLEKFILGQKHMLMEWRPKAASISQDIESRDGVWRFSTKPREYAYERIQSLLGLASEINIFRAARQPEAG